MDVFISYHRNSGWLYADQIYRFLHDKLYLTQIYYDIESTRAVTGPFSNLLWESLEHSSDVIVVVSDDYADVEDDSVFFTEIETAIQAGKNIIPVVCDPRITKTTIHPKISRILDYEFLRVSDPRYFKEDFFIDLTAKMVTFKNRSSLSPQTLSAYSKLTAFTKLETRASIDSKYSLGERLSGDVVTVSVCAFACNFLFNSARHDLERLVKNNCKIRMIINDPESAVAAAVFKSVVYGGSEDQRNSILPRCYGDMKDWQKRSPQNFEGRVTDVPLTCAIFMIECQDPAKNTIKVDFYSYREADRDRRCVLISAADEDHYQYYKEKFEQIWAISRPVE